MPVVPVAQTNTQNDPFRPVMRPDTTVNPNEFLGETSRAALASFGAQASEGAALASVGKGLGDISNVAAEIAIKEQEKVKVAKVQEGAVALNAAERDMKYGENGYMTRQGGLAVGIGKEAGERYEKIKNDILPTLTDERQRTAFGQIFARSRDANLDGIAAHEANETTKYQAATGDAAIASAITAATDAPNDEKVVENSIQTIRRVSRANAMGRPGKEIEEKELASVSALHTARIQRMIKDDPIAAAGLYDKVKSQMHGADFNRVETMLDVPLRRATVRSEAEAITGAPGPQASVAARAIFNMPAVMGAVVMGESSGNPAAQGPRVTNAQGVTARAGGLTGLWPDTAQRISATIGDGVLAGKTGPEIEAFVSDPKNAKVVYLYGAHEMDRLLKKYGDLETAYVAYNSGDGNANKWLRSGKDYSVLPKPEQTQPYVQKALSRYADATGGAGGGEGRPSIHTEVMAGGLPPPGARMTRENWGLKFYKPQDFMAPSEGGQWVDARAATMADSLGQRFFDATGIRVGINDDHDFDAKKGTSGKRRGTADPGDNPHVEDSQHLKGRAFDFQIQGLTGAQRAMFLKTAREAGFTGVGFYGDNGHLHLDTGRERSWGAVPDWAGVGLATRPTLAAPSIAVNPSQNGLPLPASMIAGANRDTSAPRVGSQSTTNYGLGRNVNLISAVADLPAVTLPPAAAISVPPPVSTKYNASAFDPQVWRDQVNGIPDAEIREGVSRMVEAKIALRERMQKETVRTAMNDSVRMVQSGKSIDDIPPETLSLISEHNPRGIETLTALEARRVKGKEAKTDPRVYLHFNNLTDSEFADVSLINFVDKLSPHDLEKLADRQRTIRNQGQKNDANNAGLQSRKEAASMALLGVGLDPTPDVNKTSHQENATRVGQFYQRLDLEIEGYKEANGGKEPRGEELQKMLKTLLTPVNNQAYFGKKAFLFEMGTRAENEAKRSVAGNGVPFTPVGAWPDERFKAVATPEEIPVDTLKTIVSNYKRHNGAVAIPKPDEAVQLYNDALAASTGRWVDPPSSKVKPLTAALTAGLGRPPTKDELRQAYSKHVAGYLAPPPEAPFPTWAQ